MNNKKTIIILILVLTIGIVGLTIAYFSNSTSVDNLFSTNPYGTTVEEVFVSPDNWLPGTTTEKLVTVTNTGLVDEAVRISYTEEWKAKAGTILSGLIDSNGYLTNDTENSERAAIINLSDNNDWTYSNEYYYYNYRLAPNETTSSLIDSVTFNSKEKSDSNCTTETNGSTKTVTCNSTNAGYDGAAYKLTFTIETVQYNKYKEAWGTNFAIANIKQQTMNVQQFLETNKNATDAEYNENTKSKMFEFNHPATLQTTELTDYRYIGEEPNNYIYFNCDNDGTNCEVWRIIGVFDVDDGTGNYEQRIKIVSGSAINKMEWDDRESLNTIGVNIWQGSKANIFLNNDYLMSSGNASTYGLKPLARTQIADAKYYLGGISKPNYSLFSGTTEDLYDLERGNDFISIELYCSDQNHSWFDICKINYCKNNPSSPYCNNIETSWVGKVGLIYPSDYAYTYSIGIDDICYNTPSNCSDYYDGNPNYGWIYNSNIGDYYQNSWYTWTITPLVRDTGSLDIEKSGNIYDTYSGNTAYIRPVVYLKSDIEIYNGDGSEDNPYCLMEECSKKLFQLNKKVKYDNDYYYIINIENDYVTLLKEEPLSASDINIVSENYVSENGEYPYLENNNCNSSNTSNCTTDYNNSDIKEIIDKWILNKENDLVSINGFKARLVTEDDIILSKTSSSGSNWYELTVDNPYYFKSNNTYWSSIYVDDTNNKVLVIGNNNNSVYEKNIYDRFYIRPVINLKKCALTNTCE